MIREVKAGNGVGLWRREEQGGRRGIGALGEKGDRTDVIRCVDGQLGFSVGVGGRGGLTFAGGAGMS